MACCRRQPHGLLLRGRTRWRGRGHGFPRHRCGAGQPGHPTGTDGVIGYIVDPRVAGQGIGSATAGALLRAAFEGLGLRRVTAAANADNLASVRVLERAGMRRERLSRRALWHWDVGWSDEVGYTLLNEEWLEPAAVGATKPAGGCRLVRR